MVREVAKTGPKWTKRIMGLLWFLFTSAYISFFYIFQDAREIADANFDGYLEVILLGVPSVVMLAGAVWLHESDIDSDLRSRMVGWTVGMAALFVLAMYAALFVIETRFDPGERWLVLLFSVGFGAAAGTVIGMMGIRSNQRERERKRSLEVARQREQERDRLEYLNQYLRHEVLNEATKIISHAELLEQREDLNARHGDSIRVIHDSGEEIATFIESIRTILDASDHDPSLVRMNVREILETEIETCRNVHPSVSITLHGPESGIAMGGELLNRVFRNLIENAIDHNGRDVSITVSLSVDDEWVEVTIRDDGDGIPVEARESLFSPPESGDHGYGLFLTRNLVELYGGRIELTETGAEGTEFRVRLPGATQAQARARAVTEASIQMSSQ